MNESEIIIEENGIRVYRDHYCSCPCKNRIVVKKYHNKIGIPKYIVGHNAILNSPMKGKKHKPESIELIKNKRSKQISPFKGKHHSLETIELMKRARIGKTPWNKGLTKETDERVKNYSKNSAESRKGKSPWNLDIHQWEDKIHPMKGKKHSKKTKEMMSKNHRNMFGSNNPNYGENKYYTKYPDKMIEHMKNMCRLSNQISKSELKVREFLDESNIKYETNVHEILGTPDIVIKDKNLLVFIDGCYWHGCEECFPFNSIDYKIWDSQEKRRNYDKSINIKLSSKGYRIFRIWEHDIKNKKYKNMLGELINENKSY